MRTRVSYHTTFAIRCFTGRVWVHNSSELVTCVPVSSSEAGHHVLDAPGPVEVGPWTSPSDAHSSSEGVWWQRRRDTRDPSGTRRISDHVWVLHDYDTQRSSRAHSLLGALVGLA